MTQSVRNTEIEKIRPYNGTFVEINTNDMREIKKIISKKCQKIPYFGIESKKIKNFVIESGLSGVDRIVPVGRALDMNLIWDGKDFRSRAGNIFEAPSWFKLWMPPGEVLDGELFMGRENFEKCGLFRKKEADCEAWKKASVTYQIFDFLRSTLKID